MAEIQCPQCKQIIYDEDALNCLYCGESLNLKTGFMSFMQSKAVIGFIALIVLLSFGLLVFR
jgi:ribosomal protein S27E